MDLPKTRFVSQPSSCRPWGWGRPRAQGTGPRNEIQLTFMGFPLQSRLPACIWPQDEAALGLPHTSKSRIKSAPAASVLPAPEGPAVVRYEIYKQIPQRGILFLRIIFS